MAGIDEVELFSSTKKSCPDCLTRKNRAGETEYFHRSVVCMTVGKALHVIGPAPAPVGKVKDIYRRVIYLKHENYDLLVRIKDRLEEYIEINSGFRKVNIQFDFL